MSENHYRIKIIKGGAEFEAEGDKVFVIEMLNRFEQRPATPPAGGKKDTSQIGVKPPASLPTSAKTTSVSEFIRSLEVKKHTDIVLAFGYYLEEHSGLSEFTPADINNCYYESKMESSNTSQMIIHNIRSSRMMGGKKGEGKKRSYVLTRTGEQTVEEWLKEKR